MIYPGKWSNLSDAARYLRDRTGEIWTETAIISRLIEIGLDTVSVSIAADTPLTQPNDSNPQEAVPCGYAQLMQVCGAAQFLHELEIAGKARPLALLNETGTRFETTTQIPSSALRLSRHEINLLPTSFHLLLEAVNRGKHPDLKTLAEDKDSDNSNEPPSVSQTNSAAPEYAQESDQSGWQSGKTTHRIRTRRHTLTAIIETAKERAANPDDYHSVWAALVRLAEGSNRPAPLLGYAEDEGVKYQIKNDIKFFTKDALRKQMVPNAR